MNNYKDKEAKGLILKILLLQYPDYVSDRLISLTLNDQQLDGSLAQIRGHLTYLEESEYVEVKEINELGIQRTTAKLTPRGWNLVHGNIPDDPGVMVIR